MKILKFSQIRIDGGTQMRVSINQDKVSDYAECMREGDKFPPIKAKFDGTNYWMWAGFHRYFSAQAAGMTTIEVDYTPGTMEDAQDLAYGDNYDHGLPRTKEDKRKSVEDALSKERHKDKSDREIARLCKVSHTLVGAVRNPEVRKQQVKNNLKSLEKRMAKDKGSGVNSTPAADPKPSLTQDYGPDEAELKANELAQQADLEALNKLLESSDALATAHAEIKRLNLAYAQLDIRFKGLMNEKSEAVRLLQKAQLEIKALRKAKK